MRPRVRLAIRPFLLSRGVLEFFHRFLGEFGYFWIDLWRDLVSRGGEGAWRTYPVNKKDRQIQLTRKSQHGES
jgi:hypothetical protein